jgi:hypothetical protein
MQTWVWNVTEQQFNPADWTHSDTITITENSGYDLSDYQILVELNASNFDFSQAESDGADIRFAERDNTLLSYWIEMWNSTAGNATVWVKVPSIPAGGTATIRMWYGNVGATSESNGTAVFILFDDFEGGTVGSSPSGWSCSGKCNNKISSDVAYSGTKSVKMAGSSGGCWESLLHKYIDEPSPYRITFSLYPPSYSASGCHNSKGYLYLKTSASWTSNGRGFINFERDNNHISACGSTMDYTPDSWYKVEALYKSNASNVSTTFSLNGDFFTECTSSRHGYEDSLRYLTFGSGDGYNYCDLIYVSKYTSPEPTITIGTTLHLITSYAPPSPVNDTIYNWRTFNITTNKAANVSWYLNESFLFTNESVREANCTLHAEVAGEHNVSAIATNANGTDMQKWVWNVVSASENTLTIPNLTVLQGESTTTQITLKNATGIASIGIKLSYNASIVNVTNASMRDFTRFFSFDSANAANGWITINTHITGHDLTGDVMVANVTLQTVGTLGDGSPLNLSILTLSDQYGTDVTGATDNGTFTIPPDTGPPAVTNASSSHEIPDDTDNDPGWGETSQLNVTVTDDDGIESVTIDLSAIGGSSTQLMTNTGGDIWSVTTNASVGMAGWNGTAYVPYHLQVNATDIYGNSNISMSIDLVVIENGDVNNDGKVDFVNDAAYLIRHTRNVPGYETLLEEVADVTGDGEVDFIHDAAYLVRYTRDVPGYEVLH